MPDVKANAEISHALPKANGTGEMLVLKEILGDDRQAPSGIAQGKTLNY
jgi:hypothetical protein